MNPISLLPLLPNRVRRNYRGGLLLDQLEGEATPRDGDRPEDWLASTVTARNPGLEARPGEGLASVPMPEGERRTLEELFATAPDFYLGARHEARRGPHLGFLAKLLDSSMRLAVQAHPTTAFAREHLNSPWGKLEAYVILGLRDEKSAYIRLGFQRPPSPQEWRRIVLEQDITSMDACFDPIPVRVGDVWLVPGGLPHAIGEGVLMLEVMEPSDLVVRCEFEREGVVVPPEARFMQTSVGLALKIFDYTPLTVTQAQSSYRIEPQRLSETEELLIGTAQTNCFSIVRFTANGATSLPATGRARLGIVTGGNGTLRVDGHLVSLQKGVRFLLAAAAGEGALTVGEPAPLQIHFCLPGE